MNSLQSLWDKNECPILNGVMFADGFVEHVKPHDQPRPVGTMSLTCQERTSIDYQAKLPVAGVIPSCRAEDRSTGIVAIGGEGGMGSDGFVAVTDFANRLQWIAFFDFSNPFVSVGFRNGEVIAENNLGERWHFPLSSPSRIKVEVPLPPGK